MSSPRSEFPAAAVLSAIVLAWLPCCGMALAQTSPFTDPPPPMSSLRSAPVVIGQIGELEGVRDPKCHATASRLEDLIFGTPLTNEARFAKNDLQKQLATEVWRAASAAASARGLQVVTEAQVREAAKPYIEYRRAGSGEWQVVRKDGILTIDATDQRQYSSVAYALRAVLAAEQDMLLDSDAAPLPLSPEATAALKEVIDLFTLSVLQRADRTARARDRYQVDEAGFRAAWAGEWRGPAPQVAAMPAAGPAGAPRTAATAASMAPPGAPATGAPGRYALLRQIIDQKVESFAKYNSVTSQVFLRNLQVYFARYSWPSDPAVGDEFRRLFTQAMLAFSEDLLRGSEDVALQLRHPYVRAADVETFAQRFIPHVLNEYEDAIFFPNLEPKMRVEIEAYDMDAFRDGGLHWRYLQDVIDSPAFVARVEPDPFAAEILTENIAQFGVLVLRIAGRFSKERDHDTLHPDSIEPALRWIQARIDLHARTPKPVKAGGQLASSTAASSGLRFSDATARSGIRHSHRMSDWLARLIRSYATKTDNVGVLAIPPAFQGSGIAAEDLDGDGWPDVLMLSGGGNRLWRNNGDGTFSDVTERAGINWLRPDGNPGEPRQPILVDFDNDGRPDIFISYANDRHRLYRNLGNMRFEDVTDRAGLGGEGLVGGPATVLDYDKDGLPDIYIGYFGDYINGIGPTLARRNTNALPDRLFRNKGNFVFEDVTERSGIRNTGWTQAVGHTDFDGDGWQDIIVGNDFGANVYYRNLGDGRFEDVTESIGTGKPSYTMGIGIADLNGDGLPDIYISNIVVMNKDEKYVVPSTDTPMIFNPEKMQNMRVAEANDLYLSRASGGRLASYELSDRVGRGYSSTGWSWFADFFDMDNDGDDDLYVVNGINPYHVYTAVNPAYEDPAGTKRNVVFPTEKKGGNVLFENRGGRLDNVSEHSGVDYPGSSRSAVFLDYDGDGDLDIILNNLQEPAVVYRNNAEKLGNNWLALRLTGDTAKHSTRDAIGATIVVETARGLKVWREVHSTSGYLSAHPKEQHFGLGPDRRAKVTVRWPNGDVDVFRDVGGNRRYTLRQGARALAAAAPLRAPARLR